MRATAARTIGLFLAAVFVVASCSSGDSAKDDVSDTVRSFLKATSEGRTEACNYLGREITTADTWGSCEEFVSPSDVRNRTAMKALSEATFEVKEVNEKLGTATVTISMESEGQRGVGDWTLRKVQGRWLITSLGQGQG